MKTLYSTLVFLILVAQGESFAFAGLGSTPAVAFSSMSVFDVYRVSSANEKTIVARRGGPPDCRGPRHSRGEHCSEMGHERGCPDGKGGCSGGKGRGHRGGKGHRGGMGRGMHHGGGQTGPAQCPQPRTTEKAPEEFYNLTNPVKSTPEIIEKGRLLFQLDAQPTCVMCHGSQGDGTGGFGANLTPPPRNFTCTETMKDISDGQLFWIIRNGSPDTGMPPFQDLQEEQIWSLINFIRSLAK